MHTHVQSSPRVGMNVYVKQLDCDTYFTTHMHIRTFSTLNIHNFYLSIANKAIKKKYKNNFKESPSLLRCLWDRAAEVLSKHERKWLREAGEQSGQKHYGMALT